MWAMTRAMVRCYDYLMEYDPNYFIVMQVHDELIFDFPFVENMGNGPVAARLAMLMEESGHDIDIPLKVSCSYASTNWAEGVDVDLDNYAVAS